ncbi:hypothetical protein PsYK624_051100 [Phanerochaete sordida]|uniref:Uncharacterized protein n=1 Tax=Phanerochaete sordida TaxID=48140 RepID=A0A9P3LB17_9APHY|nr:hypothetical protein PsYK624_051100 [Phanerochaete sordida]
MAPTHQLARREITTTSVVAAILVAAVLALFGIICVIVARRNRTARTPAIASHCSLAQTALRPSLGADASLAHPPLAHVHDRGAYDAERARPYDAERGPVYEDIVLEGAVRREPTQLPAYDAEGKPPKYVDIIS